MTYQSVAEIEQARNMEFMATSEQEAERIRERLGGDRVSILRPEWARLMREGVIATLHIRRWRARVRLTHEDLGLATSGKDFERLITLGEKRLLPAGYIKKLDSLDSAARKYLASFYATYWGTFVPVTGYADFKERMADYRSRYYALRDEIVDNYGSLIEEVRVTYTAAAMTAYARYSRLNGRSMDSLSEREFVAQFVTRIMACIPTQREIYDSFSFDVELSYIPLPSILATDAANAQGIRLRMDIEVDRLRAQRELEQERERTEIERERRIQAANRTAAMAREEMLLEMNRDVVAKAREEKERLIDDFLSTVQKQLAQYVYDACTDVLASLQRNKILHPRSVVQLQNLVANVAKLNFFEDQDVTAMVERVQKELIASDRSPVAIEDVLVSISTVARQSLIDLGSRPKAYRELGLPAEDDIAGVKLAYRSLGLRTMETEVRGVEEVAPPARRTSNRVRRQLSLSAA